MAHLSLNETHSLRPRLRLIVVGLGLYALIGGLVCILGWALDIPRLANWDGSIICIQPNTAVAAMLAGMSLMLLAMERRHVSVMLGLLLLLIGGTTVFEHLSGLNLGIDSLLLFGRTWGTTGTVVPGRMGLLASTSWALLGLGLMLAVLGGNRQRVTAPILAVLVASMAGLSLTGYAFGADALYSMPRLTAIAMQSATMVMAVAVGLIVAIPERQPMKTLVENSAAGIILRRALPLSILIPIVLGYLRWKGQAAGLYDSAFGTALSSMANVIIVVGLIWWGARILSKYERKMRKHQELAETIVCNIDAYFAPMG